jgi:diguanylate cyclase (GGDEF)-like protein/PAS domain S-box-containing protein
MLQVICRAVPHRGLRTFSDYITAGVTGAEGKTLLSEKAHNQSDGEVVPGRSERMLHFFNNAREGMIFHLNGTITDVNPSLLKLIGCHTDELIGTSVLNWITPEYQTLVKQNVAKGNTREYEIGLRHKSGQEIPVLIRPIDTVVDGHQERLVSIQEISALARERQARRQIEAQYNSLTNIDPLTRLAQRQLFKSWIDDMSTLHHADHHQFVVVHIAIERLKQVNDIFGRDIGDQLVQQWVTRLRRHLRRFSSHMVARIAGNRFAVALPFIKSTRSVVRLLENLRVELDSPYSIEGFQIDNISSSYGLAFFPEHGDDADLLMSRAEIASRQARQGSNSISRFSKAMDTPTINTLKLETRLKGALERDEMELYYQPKVDARSERVVGFEALIRWNDAHQALVMPAEFIPIAEQNGGILPIGEWVIWSACEHLAMMQKRAGPTPKVSINLSSLQFKQPNLDEMVLQAMTLFDVNPANLDLELTEGIVMSNVETSIAALRKLKALGVSISIDDFGTGYSSLSYLKRFPIDTLKVDRSFVTDITNNPQDRSITMAIIALAKSLELETVAEGVETREQFEMLQEMGCDLIQGYLFGKPLPLKEALKLL